jgi:hypothetical protein
MPILQDAPSVAPTIVTRQSHWRSEPATESRGPLADLVAGIPTFDRLPFGVNPRLDMIVREARMRGESPMPVAAVSKRYRLVQHVSLVDALVHALERIDIDPSGLRAAMTLTESGGRIRLRVELPGEFTFSAPDGHPMALTFECFNSVDRSMPLCALLGWFRFVCENGLVIGTTLARMQSIHIAPLRTDDLQPLLEAGLEAAMQDKAVWGRMARRRVRAEALGDWVDGPVAHAWGPFAAARVHSIVTDGMDGDPDPGERRVPPQFRRILNPTPVPGAQSGSDDAYSVAQALAWVAARRGDVAEQVAWRDRIPELLAHLAP